MRISWAQMFMLKACTGAVRADCTRRQVACVLVKDNRVIATGYNGAPAGEPGCMTEGACPRGRMSYAEVPASTQYDVGDARCIAAHAEANALLTPGIDPRGATAYVTDEPCPSCRILLKAAGVSKVVMLDQDPKVKAHILSMLKDIAELLEMSEVTL